MRIFIFFIMILSSTFLQAQVDTTAFDKREEVSVRNQVYPGLRSIGIQIMPFSLRTYTPRLRIGVIARMDRWSGLCDIEYGNEGIRNLWEPGNNRHYYFIGLRPEVRYAWNQDQFGNLEKFFAVELPFNYYEREIMGGDFTENGISYIFERGIQKRLRHSILFKMGVISDMGRRFFMEVYFGMGPAWRTVRYDNLINLTTGEERPDEEWGLSLNDLDAGKKIVFDLAMGLRVGYWISKKEEKWERGKVGKWRREAEE